MRNNARRGLLLLSLIGATALVAAPIASAHMVDVVGGKTKLTLNKKAKKKLSKRDIRVKGAKLAVKDGEYSFHALDDGGGGWIGHRGALRLKSGQAKLKLARLKLLVPVIPDHGQILKRGNRVMPPSVSAVVDGKRLEIAYLDTGRYEVADEHPGFSGLQVKLNKQGARLLNESLGVRLFKDGLKLGELSNRSKVEEAH